MAGKLTFTEVKEGIATIEDIQKINALLDMQHDYEAQNYDRS